MAAGFPQVKQGQEGMYVGLIASSFALAQFTTNFMWGWLSDKIGRKPVILIGTTCTAACFVAFGYCTTLWQAILVQVLMGLCNGNQGVVSTCLGEITDRTNQGKAFTYLPIVYGIGAITGPLVGGLLTFETIPFSDGEQNPYPYLAPNLFSAGILIVDLILAMIFLTESLEQAKDLPPLNKRVENLFVRLWQFYGFSLRPTYLTRAKKRSQAHMHARTAHTTDDSDSDIIYSSDNDDDDEDDDEATPFLPDAADTISKRDILNRDTILLFITFFIFQLSNIAYNSLYPIFAHGAPPTGRGLHPSEIGLSLGFAGAITIMFQIGLFSSIRERLGNKTLYRFGLAGMVLAFALTPFVTHVDPEADGNAGKLLLWAQLGVVLTVKTVSAVACLTSALLLITNSAPNHSVLGALNGLAQTLSAAGRAVGPFVSGGLFTASTHMRPRGELLAFGVFAGIAFVGFVCAFGIRSRKLEGEGDEDGDEEDVSSSDDDDDDDYDDDDDDDASTSASSSNHGRGR